ncbi:hypothetical protein LPJ81_003243 [Coemansia sp. IMI 209127]|nr:hypothetical protein LPJ81_003243 [Coemansia sp. IMI 209127]
MVSFSTCVASFMALAAAVNAGFYTTYPVGASSVTSGQTITITWTSDDQQPLLSGVSTYTLKFMTGGNIVQTTVATIGDFDISKQQISYTIPTTAAGMYFLMYTADNGAGSSWSTRFSVNGGTTWYPVGVSTGVDPGTSSTSSSGDIGEPTQSTNTGSETHSSSSNGDSTPSSSSAGGNGGDSNPSTSSSSESSPDQTTDVSTSSTTDSSGGSDNGNGNSSNNSGSNASSNAANSADSSDDSEEASSNEGSESLDNEESSSDDTKSSGASAAKLIPAAAIAAALALFA